MDVHNVKNRGARQSLLNRIISQKYFPYVMLLVTNLFLAGLLFYHIGTQVNLRNFLLFYSDNITLALYFKSLLEHGYAASGFMYGTQGFFFPGFVLYPLSYALGLLIPGDVYSASLIIKAILQVLFFNFALFYLGHAVFRSWRKAAYYASFCTLAVGVILIAGAPLAGEGWFPNVFLLTSTHHIGIAIGTPLFLAGLINYSNTKHLGNLLLLIGLPTIIMPSSGAWLVWFAIPFIIALVIVFLLNLVSKKVFILASAATVIGLVAGRLLNNLARNYFVTISPDLTEISRIPEGLRGMRWTIINVYLQEPALMIALAIMTILCCYGLLHLCAILYRSSRFESGSLSKMHEFFPQAIILSYCFVAGIALTLAAIFIGLADITRYYSMFVVFALLAAIPLFLLSQKLRVFIVIASMSTLTALLLASLFALPHAQTYANPAQLTNSDYVSIVANKDLPGDFIGDFWTVMAVGLYVDVKVSNVTTDLRLSPILQNTYDLDNAQFQNLLIIEGSALESVLEDLPPYSSKYRFEAQTATNQFVSLIIYHWDEHINEYLRR